MKHVIPIISLILSVLAIIASAISFVLLVMVAVSGEAGQVLALAILGVPCLFVATALALISAVLGGIFFKKHKLCLVAFIISLVSAALVVSGYIILAIA